jgi:hypothetical protein
MDCSALPQSQAHTIEATTSAVKNNQLPLPCGDSFGIYTSPVLLSSTEGGLFPNDAKALEASSKPPSLPDTETSSSEPSSDNQSEEKKSRLKAKKDYTPNVTDGHFRWWGHGRNWTLLSIVCAICGSVLAILARNSTEFVKLGTPITVAPIYKDVTYLGAVNVDVCFIEINPASDGCQTFKLHSDDVDDVAFEAARVLLTLSARLGTLLTAFVLTSTFWESINLKAVGLGFLVVYFAQALSMLLFDSEVCHEHDCTMGKGGILCILASVFWIFTCIATAKMDVQKKRLRRRRRRRAKRAAKANAALTSILVETLDNEDQIQDDNDTGRDDSFSQMNDNDIEIPSV